MKFSPLTLGGAVLALLLMQPAAHADPIPWKYSWSGSPPVIHADAPGTSTITLPHDNTLTSMSGDSNIVAVNLQTSSDASPSKPDHFTHAGYSLNLFLYDSSSKQGQTLTFTGFITGDLSATTSTLVNTLTGQTTQSVRLGDHLYTATIWNCDGTNMAGVASIGSITSYVTITIQTLPEPSTLTLSGVGVILLGVARWRRRRRAAREQAPS